jgi:hypothetical protein
MPLIGTGIVGPGHMEYFDVVLSSGHRYSVDVQPVEPGVDFDLHILDQNGNIVDEDISAARDAYCTVTPRWTGPFRLVVESARGISAYRIQVQD